MSLIAILVLAAGQDATAPGELRRHATPQSIGIEWDLAGDANHNATCTVQYRRDGTGAWKTALPLFRIDFHGWYADRKPDRGYNMFAGSILFLDPGTRYEVKLEVADPDGGAEVRTLPIETRSEPRRPEGGRTFHVAPGAGGGEGSEKAPFQGLAAAQAAARPGDLFLLHRGEYGAFAFTSSGEKGKAIGWKAAGDGEAVLASVQVAASHLWLEELTFRKADRDTALKAEGSPAEVVLRRNRFAGFHNSIVLSRGSQDWHIADNVIVGDNEPGTSRADGEGIDLYQSGGHVVCHNRISRTESGVHYPSRNCDIFGNDIFDTTDDGIEPDYGYANLRIWGNRITNYKNNGLSFQPMYCGPWYFIRNQVIGPGYIFKFRVQDRFVLANNTFVTWVAASDRMHHVLYSLSRNNLYISAGPRSKGDPPLWSAYKRKDEPLAHVRPTEHAANWMTDVDYDGFDWGNGRAIVWQQKEYTDLASFAREVGIENHGVRVRKEEIFGSWTLPEKPGPVELQALALREGSNAIDAGAALPNIIEDFEGKAPDLGAHEHGRPPLHFGPRK